MVLSEIFSSKMSHPTTLFVKKSKSDVRSSRGEMNRLGYVVFTFQPPVGWLLPDLSQSFTTQTPTASRPVTSHASGLSDTQHKNKPCSLTSTFARDVDTTFDRSIHLR